MWNKKVQICKERELIGPSQAGGDLFDTAVGTTTDLFVHHGLPWMSKKAVEMGRYYGSEEIQGSFYEPELLPAKRDIFRIKKVIWRDYKKKQALVKCFGYNDDFNSWISLSSL